MKESEFKPVKLYIGTIFNEDSILYEVLEILAEKYGEIQTRSERFEFTQTNYYVREMGSPLFRQFFVFKELISPELMADIKIHTNRLEEQQMVKHKTMGRVINLDPGIIMGGSMIVATAKNFSHRIPLKKGIYAHLEYMFTKKEVKELPWTYLDFRSKEYKDFFLKVRKEYLSELKEKGYR